ncbi:Herc4, partial [Symbiodinium microadriaticum]
MYQGALEDGRGAVRILALIYAAHSAFPSVHVSEFINDAICDDYMPSLEARKREYKLWLNDLGTASTTQSQGVSLGMMVAGACQSFISFNFLLTASTKALVLELDAAVQMRQGMHHEYEEAVASGSQFMSPYLVLRVRRDNVVMDTLSHIVAFSDSDFKKPLKVVFDNEEGIDAGGVRKEFYQIMMKQLLDPSFGMFRYFEESRLLWFNSDSFESESEFELIGILLGVAIYNSVIIDFKMPS